MDRKVSDTLIRDCLPEEYKQGYRRENAKKKKKKESKLAPVVVLNKQEGKELDEEQEKPEKQEVVMIGADGMTYVQQEGDTKPSTSIKDNSISKDKVFSQTTKLQERQEQQPVDRSSQFGISSKDKMESKETTPSSESSYDGNKDILPFEFRLSRKEIQDHLDSVEPNDDDDICFNVTIDLETGHVISADIGRQEKAAEESSRSVTATVYPMPA